MDSITKEQIKILAAHRLAIAVGAVSTGVLIVAVLQKHHDISKLLVWFVLLMSIAGLRWWLFVYISKHGTEAKISGNKLVYCLIAGAFANGIVWGYVHVGFFPGDPLTLALVVGGHAAYVSAASSSTSIYLPVFFGFVVTSSMMLAIGFLLADASLYWPFVVLTIIYLLVSIQLGVKNNTAFTEEIRLRFENIALLSEVRDQRDRAESAMESKNSFLAAASHDLRQPVHALGLFVDSLESYQQGEAAHRILEKIRQTIDSLGSLFHGLLDLSKLDAGVIENNPRHFEIDNLLVGIYSEFQGLAYEKGIDLKFPMVSDIVVHADPNLLERILRNLISNAIKYTAKGEVSLRIISVPGDELRIDVVDTGSGIPEAELENIFSEYHQLEKPERDRQRGMGLGLAIVQRLCDMTNIPIMVQSELDRGSTFSLIVPRGDIHKITTTLPRVHADTDLAGRRVVVIDDELSILDGMNAILTSWGCDVMTADSPEVAMLKLNVFGVPDVVIADFRLRDNANGLDTIRLIRDRFRNEIPAILVTGDTAIEKLQQTLVASVRVLHKPVSPDKLRDAILDQIIS